MRTRTPILVARISYIVYDNRSTTGDRVGQVNIGCEMNKSDLRAAVIAAIAEVENRCGRDEPELINDTRPITDLAEWDSLLGVEATLIVEENIGQEIAIESIFVTEGDDAAPRSIDEIVDLLSAVVLGEQVA